MDAHQQKLHRRTNALLWLSILGPGAAWLVYLLLIYLTVQLVRKTGATALLHVVSGTFLVLTISGGYLARAAARRMSEEGESVDEQAQRAKFMSLIGLLASIEFSIIIICAWMAIFIVDPWQT